MGNLWHEALHAHRPLRCGSMPDPHARRPSFICEGDGTPLEDIDAAKAVATSPVKRRKSSLECLALQRKNSFSLAGIHNLQSPLRRCSFSITPTTPNAFSPRDVVPLSLRCLDETFESAISCAPILKPPTPPLEPAQSAPSNNSLRRMFTFGASVLTKGLTRAETLPNPKPAVQAATTSAAAGRTGSASAGTTPESKSSSAVGRFASVVGLRSKDGAAAASDSKLDARQTAARRNDVGRQAALVASAFSRFRCAKCAQGFSSAGSLALHERVHLGEKPYVCPLCGAGFTTAGDLHRHAISERKGGKQNWGKAKQPESGGKAKLPGEAEQARSGEEKNLLARQQKSTPKKTATFRKTASIR